MVVAFLSLQPAKAETPELTFLTEEYPPFSFSNAGQVHGISVEIVREIANRLGAKKPLILVLPWSRAFDKAQQNKGYALFSVVKNREREPKFKWVGPLASYQGGYFVAVDTTEKVTEEFQLKNMAVVGVKDSIGIDILKEKGFSNVIEVTDPLAPARLIAANRVDAWITSDISGFYKAKKAKVSLSETYRLDTVTDHLFLAFNIQTPDSEINRWQMALDELKQEGLIDRILNEYR